MLLNTLGLQQLLKLRLLNALVLATLFLETPTVKCFNNVFFQLLKIKVSSNIICTSYVVATIENVTVDSSYVIMANENITVDKS